MDKKSIIVLAMFFDDIRLEVGNKFSLIGQYSGVMNIHEGSMPVDRLAVLLHMRWHPDLSLNKGEIRISVTGQPLYRQDIPIPPLNNPIPRTEFSANIAQIAVHMRFPPLRVGDSIDVWADLDGVEYVAGRLRVENAVQQ